MFIVAVVIVVAVVVVADVIVVVVVVVVVTIVTIATIGNILCRVFNDGIRELDKEKACKGRTNRRFVCDLLHFSVIDSYSTN